MKTNNDKLLFIHIPKTGGSTLQSILNRAYGKNQVFDVQNNRKAFEFDKLSPAEKQLKSVIKGHMAYGHHAHYSDTDNVSYITMLRNPISRLISNYYFILKQENHHTHKKLIENNYSLKDYVESGVLANTENAQVRLLSNNIDTPHGECTLQMLEEAKKNLELHFSVIGVSELFDQSILLMQEYYNWKTPYYLRTNVTGHGVKVKDLDQETLDTIIAYNKLDIELYNWTKNRLEQQIKSGGEEFIKKLASFQRKNKLIQHIGKLKNRLMFR
jgi:hypothetical protein